jgi:hypothetical protein
MRLSFVFILLEGVAWMRSSETLALVAFSVLLLAFSVRRFQKNIELRSLFSIRQELEPEN